MKNRIIAPSILSANFLELGREIDMLNQSECEWIHVDVMDGVFVPNISFGLPILSQIKPISKKVLDVHLMIVEPDKYIEAFKKAGADILTVHYEVCNHLHRTLQVIRDNDMKTGISLNPHTPISVLEDIITEIDVVLLMSVNPGFGGQKFIPNTINKVKQLQELIESKGANTLIEIDGGVNTQTAKQLFDAGADALVAGSFVFNSENPQKTIIDLKRV